MDLFAARENTQCALWFSLSTRDNPPLGVDAFAHRPWPRMLLYAFPPVPLIPWFLDRVQQEQLSVHGRVMVSMPAVADIRPPVGTPMARGRSLSGRGSDQELPSDRSASVGLAAEREWLERQGLSQDVVQTIQSGRATSTRASYTAKWTAFQWIPLRVLCLTCFHSSNWWTGWWTGIWLSAQLKLMLLLFRPVMKVSVTDRCSATL